MIPTPVTLPDGRSWPSLRALASEAGISPDGMRRRLAAGSDPFAAPARSGGTRKRYTDPQGRAWASLRAMADAYGLGVETVRLRLARGATIRAALAPVGSVKDPRTGEIVRWVDLERETGIPLSTLRWRFVNGRPLLSGDRRVRNVNERVPVIGSEARDRRLPIEPREVEADEHARGDVEPVPMLPQKIRPRREDARAPYLRSAVEGERDRPSADPPDPIEIDPVASPVEDDGEALRGEAGAHGER